MMFLNFCVLGRVARFSLLVNAFVQGHQTGICIFKEQVSRELAHIPYTGGKFAISVNTDGK
jgi:hypothetical protein